MTSLDRLRPARMRRSDDEAGVAILMVLAYIGIFTSLMLAMLAIVIGQVKPTAQARKDIGSVNAAASGLQAALTTMRSAIDSTGEGNRGRLPCTSGAITRFRAGNASSSTPGAKIPGTASALAGNFRYEVSVAYFSEDPTDRDPAWLQSKALGCPLTVTPTYAYLQSYGVGGRGRRRDRRARQPQPDRRLPVLRAAGEHRRWPAALVRQRRLPGRRGEPRRRHAAVPADLSAAGHPAAAVGVPQGSDPVLRRPPVAQPVRPGLGQRGAEPPTVHRHRQRQHLPVRGRSAGPGVELQRQRALCARLRTTAT